MEEMFDQLVTVGAGLAILAGAWLIWFLSGVVNNLFTTQKWSWKRMFEDIVKTAVMGLAILSWVILMNVLDWYTGKLSMDISSVLDGATVVGLLAVIVGGSANYAFKAYRNFVQFIGEKHVAKVTGEQDYASIAKDISDVVSSLYIQKEAVDSRRDFEETGGRGTYYNVPIESYEAFRGAVLGKGYNIDGAYGAQCWDGTGLLWQQVGMWLQTGNGCAYGCWTLKRNENAGDKFTLITDKAQVRRGDVVVFRAGEYGHIGFADEDYNGGSAIRLLGQNQGGAAYAGGGACFNVINMSMATFLGAFRYNGWSYSDKKPESSDTPTAVTPTKPQQTSDIKKGDRVKVLRYVDVNGTALLDLQPTPYLVFQSNKANRTAVLKSDDGDIYARMAWENIQKAA